MHLQTVQRIIIQNTETKNQMFLKAGGETNLEISSNLVYSLIEDKEQNMENELTIMNFSLISALSLRSISVTF